MAVVILEQNKIQKQVNQVLFSSLIHVIIHCTHYMPSHWQLILEISATYRLVSYLLADN